MSASILLPWLLTGAAVAVLLVTLARARAAAQDAAQREREADALQAELSKSRKRLESAEAKHRRGGEELVELRRKLDKAKKRAAKTGGDTREPNPSRATDREKDLETARQMRDSANEEVRKLTEELVRLRALARSQAAQKPLLSNSEIEALQQKLRSSDSEAGELRSELEKLRKDVGRLREKGKTQEQLYVAIRGELQAKKDRLRVQTEEVERLRSLQVVLGGDDA